MRGSSTLTIWTLGHSTHQYERFLELLRAFDLTAIADVRSSPYSRHFPQFNGPDLRSSLRRDDIAYVFLGEELGGRPRDRKYYLDGVADYERMATAPGFLKGLGRVLDGARNYSVALMCSESNPLDCHRCLLVGRALSSPTVSIRHILADGQFISQSEVEEKLLKESDRANKDLFASRHEQVANAYRERARKFAFADPESMATTRLLQDTSTWKKQTSQQ